MDWAANTGPDRPIIAMAADRRRRTGSRLFALLGLAGLAGLAVAAGGDRIGVPVADTGWFALRRAQMLPADLVAAAPLRQGYLTLALAEQARARGGALPSTKLRAATSMGWRDPYLQAWSLLLALAEGRSADAVDRMEALLRAHPRNALAGEMLSAISADKAAASELSRRLAQNPDWAAPVVSIASRAEAREQILPMLASAARSGFRPAITTPIERMAQNDPGGALELLVALRGGGDLAASGLWNADPSKASHLRERTGPFSWRKSVTGRARLTGLGTRTLGIEPPADGPTYVAGIFAPVEAGTYRIGWRVGQADERPVVIDAQCVDGRWIENGSINSESVLHWREIAVPAACEFVQLRMLAPSSRGNLEVSETTLLRID